jgi:MFS family permease
MIAAIAEIQAFMVIPMMGLLSTELQISPAATTWVLLSTLIAGAVAIGPMTRLADRRGPKHVYLWSTVAILIGNGMCALALTFTSPTLMITGRALVGLNICTALGVSVLKHSCSERQIKYGVGMITLGLGVGVAPSFLLAGIMLDAGASLSTVFWVATAMTLVVVCMVFLLPETPGTPTIAIRFGSSALLAAWAVPGCFALSLGNEWGWTSLRIVGLAILSVLAFVVWVRHEASTAHPLVDPRLLKGQLAVAYYCLACVGLLAYGYYITGSAFVQISSEVGFGFSSTITESGLILLPAAIIVPILGMFSGRLMGRTGPRPLLFTGAVILAAQFVAMVFVKDELWQMYAYACWFGIGIGLFLPAGWAAVAASAKPNDVGIAGGMAQIFQLLASALISAVGVVFTTRNFVPDTSISVESGYNNLFWFLAVALVIAAVLTLIVKPDNRPAISQP